MLTKDIIYKLRTEMGISQEELATKVFVTRQAVSRWENGETIPNVDTLKLLSQLFDVSINTLLGMPVQLSDNTGDKVLQILEEIKIDNNTCQGYSNWCHAEDNTIDFWKNYAKIAGQDKLDEFKQQLIAELNTLLKLYNLPMVENLNVLPGDFVNLEYTLPNGKKAKFLNDSQTYLCSQIEYESKEICFGVVANMDFILVCSYGENGSNPELLIYKKR